MSGHTDERSHPKFSHQFEFLHGAHTAQYNHQVKYLLKPWFHYLCIHVFQQCWIDDIWCVIPSSLAENQHMLWISLQCESELVCKKSIAVWSRKCVHLPSISGLFSVSVEGGRGKETTGIAICILKKNLYCNSRDSSSWYYKVVWNDLWHTAGVLTHDQPRTCLLDAESLDWYLFQNCRTILRDRLKHPVESACDLCLSIPFLSIWSPATWTNWETNVFS